MPFVEVLPWPPQSRYLSRTGRFGQGIGYLAAKRGASAETGLAIGAIGIVDAAAWGFGVGMIAGPAGGVIAGAAAGM